MADVEVGDDEAAEEDVEVETLEREEVAATPIVVRMDGVPIKYQL